MQCRWHQQPTHVRREGHAGTASQVKGRCCSSVILEDAGGCQGCIGYFKIFKACRSWQVLKTDIYYLPSGFLKKYDTCWLQAAKFCHSKNRHKKTADLKSVLHVFWVGVVQSCWSFGRVAGHNPMTILTETTGWQNRFRSVYEMWWWSRKLVNGTCPKKGTKVWDLHHVLLSDICLSLSPLSTYKAPLVPTSSYKTTNESRTEKNNTNLSVITAILVVSKSARDDLEWMGWNPALVDIPRHPNTCWGWRCF